MGTRVASWNVNGIRACFKNGFLDWLNRSNFDVVALQEVRAEENQIPPELLSHANYCSHWFAAQKKGYSGTGILCKRPPLKVFKGMGRPEFDAEGRVLTAEFEDLFVVSAYFPNSQDKGARIEYKLAFCEAIHHWVKSLRALNKPVILTGDFNIAHQAIDLARPDENETTAGYLPEEREWMSGFLESGWVDTWRLQNPKKISVYSWWSARMRARERNVGWRIDYHTLHSRDQSRIISTGIECDSLGSDHCPVVLEIDARI